jgi:uncharacterized membrane protein YwaF
LALAAAFELFGISHLIVLALTLLLPALLIIAARKANSPRFTTALCWTMAAVLLANEVGYYVRGLQDKTWIRFVQSSLPLHLCGIGLYMTVLTLVSRP